MNRLNVILSLAFVTLTSTAVEAAPLLTRQALSPQAQRTLTEQIRTARAHDPAAFNVIADLEGLRPAVYSATRLQRPTVARELRSMGPSALMPMLDVLAVSGYSRTLNATEQQALEVGLLEAIGALRDRRAEPAMRAAFESMSNPTTILAAARGLGALCGDSDIAYLASSARAAGPRQTAAIEGLGRCRRPEAARAVIAVLDGTSDEAMVIAASHALASAGSSWAQTSVRGSDEVTSLSAAALVRAFVRMTGEARNQVEVAILSVGYTGTPQLLTQASATALPEVRTALSALQHSVQLGLARAAH